MNEPQQVKVKRVKGSNKIVPVQTGRRVHFSVMDEFSHVSPITMHEAYKKVLRNAGFKI
jgi:hypothetical protein